MGRRNATIPREWVVDGDLPPVCVTTHGSLPVSRAVVERFHRRRRRMSAALAAGVLALVVAASAAHG